VVLLLAGVSRVCGTAVHSLAWDLDCFSPRQIRTDRLRFATAASRSSLWRWSPAVSMGNKLVSQANVDAHQLDEHSGAHASPVRAAVEPDSKPPSRASELSAVAAGIPHAEGPERSPIPRKPEQVWDALGASGREFVERCFRGLPPAQLIDVHTHIVGIGTNGSGCAINYKMNSPITHPLCWIKKKFFLAACGVTGSEADCDLKYAALLANLVENCTFAHSAPHGRCYILAFDQFYDEQGVTDPARTGLHVPNEWVWQLAAAFPEQFVPVCSVHPYRKDAVQQLELWASRGARMVKWLPNSMGINPSHPLCQPFYHTMRRLGLILLTHTGVEHSVDAGFHDNMMGNPILLRAPLDAGVRVIAAHCASEGTACLCSREVHELEHLRSEEADSGSDEDEEQEERSQERAAKRHKLSIEDKESAPSAHAAALAAAAASGTPAVAAAPGPIRSWLGRFFGHSSASGSSSAASSSSAAVVSSSSPTAVNSRKRKSSADQHLPPPPPPTAAPCNFSSTDACANHRPAGQTAGKVDGVRLSNFELFIKLMDCPKYNGLLFGDISSVCAHKRVDVLETLLNRTDLHPRLINGSDFPVPAVYVVVWTSQLRRRGLIKPDEERHLNVIFQHNPLLFDFCLKRCMRSSTGSKFLDCVFIKPALFKGSPRLHEHEVEEEAKSARERRRSVSRQRSPARSASKARRASHTREGAVVAPGAAVAAGAAGAAATTTPMELIADQQSAFSFESVAAATAVAAPSSMPKCVAESEQGALVGAPAAADSVEVDEDAPTQPIAQLEVDAEEERKDQPPLSNRQG